MCYSFGRFIMRQPLTHLYSASNSPRAPKMSAARALLGRSAWALLLAFALAGTAAAQAERTFEQRLNGLIGHWLEQSKDAASARILRLTNVIFADGKSADLAGEFGPASAPIWPEARDITARFDGKRIAFEIITADNAKLVLTVESDGELRGPGAARFVRTAVPDVHRHAAEHPPPQLRARAGSRIELVYIGADDCSLCKRWEAAYLGRGKLEGSPDWKHLQFTMVKLPTLSTPFRADYAPQRLQPLIRNMLDSGLRIHGVPSFVLLVDDKLRSHALGPGRFDTLIHPTVRAAVREKAGTAER